MSWRELTWLLACGALLLSAAQGVVGCNDDGPILWQRPQTADGGDGTGPNGGGDDGPMPPPPGGAPPIPCIPDGPEPEQVCICPPSSACFCEPGGGGELCALACENDSSCDLTCGSETSCNLDCDVGCTMRCEPFSTCTIGCGGDCAVVCGEGAHCTLWSWDAPSEIYCELGAQCECPIPDGCVCSGPGCPPPPG